MNLRVLAVVVGGTFTMAGAARAQDPTAVVPPGTPVEPMPPPVVTGGGQPEGADLFGTLGQIAITSELAASFQHASATMSSGSSTTILVAPAVDYFVAPHASVGGALSISHSSFDSGIPGAASSDRTTYGLRARGGYDVRLAPSVSIWPRLELGYSRTSFTGGSSAWSIPLRVAAPVLFHPAAHFFFGIGPDFGTDLVSKAGGSSAPKTTVFGLTSVVGGYFGT